MLDHPSPGGNATKAVAIGILRSLWDDFSYRGYRNNNTTTSQTKYVPIALTAPSSGFSTVKSIIIESPKNKNLPYPPSNLITIHNFHPSVDELRPATKGQGPTHQQQHLFQNSDYDNWDDQKEEGSSSSSNSIINSEEIMSQLPISIKRAPIVTATVTVRPMRFKNKMPPLRVQIISSSEDLNSSSDNDDDEREEEIIIAQATSHDQTNYAEDHRVGQNSVTSSLNESNKNPERPKNKTRKKIIKNKLKKSPVSSTTSSTIIVAEEEYGAAPEGGDEPPLLEATEDNDDPVDPDLETQQQQQQIEESNKNTEDEGENGEGQDQDSIPASYSTSSVKSECPRNNKFSANNRDDRCRRSQNKKRPKQKFDFDHWENMMNDEDDDDGPPAEGLSRHKVKIPKIKVPKIKVPKIKVPKIKPPKVKLSHKDIPTMMAMMKTFMDGVGMATMFNPMNFGLWTVVLHPVTMFLIGMTGVIMYCFPWTSVAMLTSRKHSGNTIDVKRIGRSRSGIIEEPSPDWLEDRGNWILGVINNYTFRADL